MHTKPTPCPALEQAARHLVAPPAGEPPSPALLGAMVLAHETLTRHGWVTRRFVQLDHIVALVAVERRYHGVTTAALS